ncbi:hypothetical protein DRN69_01765 [Candidatus Pacearchaeota archaeon]|nr:MAG: hypothetical protein DRN69_01765 [Candidatus Pacearchaeota archaeon]
MYRLRGKNAQLHELENKLESTEGKLHSLKNEIENIEKKILDTETNIKKAKKGITEINKLKKKLFNEKDRYVKILKGIVQKIDEAEHIRQLRGENDPRNKISQKTLNKNEEKKINEIYKKLEKYGIIGKNFKNEVIKESVNKMLKELAEKTHGYVGADIESICKEAAMHALRRVLPDISGIKDKELPREIIDKLTVNKEDFNYAMQKVEPSAMREVLVEIPNVKWEDIGGLEEVKQKLKEVVEWPLKYPDKFKHFHITPPKGILLYGPPGTGKTLLAKAVANESGANFISVKGPELLSKYVGESEKKLREIFRKAKQAAPSIIFFDEIDAMTHTRGIGRTEVVDTLVSQLLTEMSGIEELKNVVVMAATNRPDIIDYSLLRPGRFDRHILVPAPDEKARLEILKIHTRGIPLSKDVDLEELAKKTKNFSGADLESLCRESAMRALRENLENKKVDKVEKKHFEETLKKMRPSIPEAVAKSYEEFDKALKTAITKKEKKKKVTEPEYLT